MTNTLHRRPRLSLVARRDLLRAEIETTGRPLDAQLRAAILSMGRNLHNADTNGWEIRRQLLDMHAVLESAGTTSHVNIGDAHFVGREVA